MEWNFFQEILSISKTDFENFLEKILQQAWTRAGLEDRVGGSGGGKQIKQTVSDRPEKHTFYFPKMFKDFQDFPRIFLKFPNISKKF